MIPKTILLCTDFSENSVPARICATEYAKAFKAKLMILHIVNSRLVGYRASRTELRLTWPC